MSIFKRLKCQHDYHTVSNYYGDYINLVSLRHLYRSSMVCSKCGKVKYSPYLDYSCKTINDGTYVPLN